jgi:hypothetical protein
MTLLEVLPPEIFNYYTLFGIKSRRNMNNNEGVRFEVSHSSVNEDSRLV